MATRQEIEGNKTKDTGDFETLPPVDDDAEPTPGRPAPVDRAGQEGDGEDLPPRRIGDPGRDAIAARFKELQRLDRVARGEIEPGPDDVVEPDADDDSAAEPDAPPAAPAAADDQEMELLVYGEVHKFKRSDLVDRYHLEGLDDARIIEIAQKHMAADRRLAEAKTVADQRLAGAKPVPGAGEAVDGGEADQPDQPAAGDADGLTRDRPPRDPNQGLNEEKLDEIVQRVQFGDPDEAKQALRDFGEEIRRSLPSASSEDVLNQFEQRLAQRQHQTEIYESLQRFGEENPDLASNKRLVQVGLDIAAEEMVKDLKGIGLKDEHLKPLLEGDPQTVRKNISAAHWAVRLQGHKVRSFDQLLQAAGTSLRTEFNLPKGGGQPGSQPAHPATPGGQARERLHRKEIAQQQPRHGGARAGAPQGSQRPKTAAETVQEMRRNRGFVSHA